MFNYFETYKKTVHSSNKKQFYDFIGRCKYLMYSHGYYTVYIHWVSKKSDNSHIIFSMPEL